MNYSDTIHWLYTQLPMFQRIGPAAYKADLGNITTLCHLLGNPQNTYPTIHIAGTNGKGSVAHMTASVLQEAGYKTGLFTSPHLVDFRERIRINGSMIPEEVVTDFVESIRKRCEEIKPSFFELTTALAFDYFSREQVDIAVIETGMGGRLDSTNIIRPVISVITNIGMDHQQFLGSTREKIAMEKAGIIKNGIPVVIGETQEGVSSVFIERAREMHAPIWFADQMPSWNQLFPSKESVSAEPEKSPHIPDGVNYQRKNRQTVGALFTVLNLEGYNLSNKAVQHGIHTVKTNTGLRGRWEILTDDPLVICDVGHNEAGIREVVEQIGQTPHHQLHFVFGTVGDKDPEGVLKLLPKEAVYYFCKADIPRGMETDILMQHASRYTLQGRAYPSVVQAFKEARSKARPDDLIFIGGSTFVVAEIISE